MSDDIAAIRRAIRDIPNFPKPGIVFKDITPLLADGPLFAKTIDCFAARYEEQKIDTVLGVESRGFIVGAALAYRLGAGFSVVRKPGKLPYETHKASYELEYGTDSLEIHIDAINRGARVVIAGVQKMAPGLRVAVSDPGPDKAPSAAARVGFLQMTSELQAAR